MKYCVDTPNRVWYLKPDCAWYGKDKSFKFRIVVESYYECENFPVTRRIFSGFDAYLEGSPVTVKNAMHNIVALLVI